MSRLEDIQKKRYFFHDIKDSELKEDWEWLIQQAERVEELEKTLNTAIERGAKMAYKNVSYKQVLERVLDFYPGVPNAEYIPIEMLFEIKGIAHRGLEREG